MYCGRAAGMCQKAWTAKAQNSSVTIESLILQVNCFFIYRIAQKVISKEMIGMSSELLEMFLSIQLHWAVNLSYGETEKIFFKWQHELITRNFCLAVSFYISNQLALLLSCCCSVHLLCVRMCSVFIWSEAPVVPYTDLVGIINKKYILKSNEERE